MELQSISSDLQSHDHTEAFSISAKYNATAYHPLNNETGERIILINE